MKPYLTRIKTTKSRLKASQKDLFRNALCSFFAIAILGFSFVSPALATGVFDLPSFDADNVWVVDQAKEISLDTQNKLKNQFQELAEATGQELRMVAVRRLDYGETAKTLANELFDSWYPNEEDRANQTLLVMDTLTNTTAIKTGEEAASFVDSEIAKSIVKETVGYNLRTGNKYNQALLDASDRLVAVLSGEVDPGPPAIEENIQVEGTFTKAEDTKTGVSWTWVIVILIVATVVPMVTYYLYVL